LFPKGHLKEAALADAEPANVVCHELTSDPGSIRLAATPEIEDFAVFSSTANGVRRDGSIERKPRQRCRGFLLAARARIAYTARAYYRDFLQPMAFNEQSSI